MASSSSWFARSPSSKRDYELPRWQPPAHMAASIIPLPIVQSTYKQSPKLSTVLPARSVVLDKPLAAISRESELQADLQFLLDAQAEGLIKGLQGGNDDASSQGSSTPVARHARQINRPVRKRLGLRSARKGIYNCIVSLGDIKSEEIVSVDHALQKKAADLAQIDAWESKRERLTQAMKEVHGEDENIRVSRLQQEGDTLQQEINKVEMHLMELKAKRRRVLKQAAAIENAVQAKLSSYTTSLSLLEADIRTFLSAQPIEDLHATQVVDDRSVWQLPQDRRTLALAKQQLDTEQQDVKTQLKELQFEEQALQDGAQMWKDVVSQVTDFERLLRSEMSNLSDSTVAWDDSPQASASDRLRELYKHMLTLIANLERQVGHAEQHNWRLLVAAIGAELDALRRGKQILDGLVGSQAEETENDQPMPPRDLQHHNESDSRSDTDEEPDPELLFSVQDPDDADE